jgi:RHS repeat-associated protein
VYVNDMVTPYLDQWAANPVNVYGATGVSLAAGQVVQIKYEFMEVGGLAHAQMLVKTTDGTTVSPRVVPSSMLQTGAVAVAEPRGLVGRYYTDPGAAHTFPTNQDDPSRLFLTRTDSSLNQNWGLGSPVPGGPADRFMVRWTGQIQVPVTDTYVFGVGSDDGARVFINNNPTPVTNAWSDHGSSPVVYGTGVALTANTPVNITVEYYENGGGAEFGLYARPQSGPVVNKPVDPSWLLPQAQILPNGWGLALDGDGSLSYSFASINTGGVTLYDSAGQTHEWKFANGAFTPPPAETGHMVRNGDGTVTLQDTDGQTYIFAANGSIKSVTKPSDDRNPAALQYMYASFNNNPARLTQISDPVSQSNINDASTASRWLKVYYGNDTANCPAVPSGQGFLAVGDARHQYICGVATSDGRTTGFYYTANANNVVVLSRVVLPGNDSTDYGYSLEGLLTGVRSSLANDAVTAGVRTQDATLQTTIAYDALRRVSGVTLPAATAGATRLAHNYEYRPANTSTLLHVANSTEPNGFSRKVQYDATYRTVADTDIANLTTQTEWDAAKDLVKSTTDAAGLRSTTLYDYADRVTDTYGPAPTAWFDTNTASVTYNKPLTTPVDYTPQIPRNQSIYEENINGLAAAYHEVTTASNGTGSSTKVLFGNPKLHGTGVGPTTGDILKTWGASAPITPTSGNGWGVSLTGWIRLATNGNHTFRVHSDDGVRLWVDDTLVTNDWTDGALRNHPANGTANNVFNNTQGDKWYRIRLDYYNKSVGTVLNTDAQIGLYMTPPAGVETSALGSLLKPNYGLVTTSRTFDDHASVGNQVTTKNYGANPELGLVQSSTVDPGGLALTTSSAYEPAGTGSFLRQLSNTLPGGEMTGYSYYGSTETRANPCVVGSPAVSQAGLLKLKTEPDPDGTGVQTSITSETVYDVIGRVVATRLNADAWRCTTYDARGRVTQLAIPAQPNTPHVTRSARTVTNNYAVNGNPLVTSIADSSGSVTKTSDMLGRITIYAETQTGSSDVGTTLYGYDSIGRLASKSNEETEEYTYDNFNRMVNFKINATTYATSSYDTYSRLQQVTYPVAGQQKLVLGRDSLGRVNAKTYAFGNGTTTAADTVTLSQSGQIVSGTALGNAKSYAYDKASRLKSASYGTSTYTYSYAAPSATTCNQASANLNAHKSGNMTSQTINSSTTTFCYDKASRLIASSNGRFPTPQYDAHGNMSAGSPTSATKLEYDSSDRSVYTAETDSYNHIVRDPLDRVQKNEDVTGGWFGYADTSDSPAYIHSSGGTVSETYHRLPGGTMATMTTSTGSVKYSMTDIRGDVFTTASNSGTQSSTHIYQPFGAPSGTPPTNLSGDADFGYLGQYGKTATNGNSRFMQMGARLYLPTLNRFAQVDPIYGGTENNYAYVADPINSSDLDGKCPWCFVALYFAIRASPYIIAGGNAAAGNPVVGGTAMRAGAAATARGGASAAGGASRGAKDLTKVGPNAHGAVKSHSTSSRLNKADRQALNNIGNQYGCHSCGARTAGTKSGNWVGDHQPVTALNTKGEPQWLYPHCIGCSNQQGGQVSNLLRIQGGY